MKDASTKDSQRSETVLGINRLLLKIRSTFCGHFETAHQAHMS